jgi:hypothetical protein
LAVIVSDDSADRGRGGGRVLLFLLKCFQVRSDALSCLDYNECVHGCRTGSHSSAKARGAKGDSRRREMRRLKAHYRREKR